MSNIIYWLLVTVICAVAVGGGYISFILILLSGFIFDDADLTRLQRQPADSKALMISLFGAISLCVSVLLLLISNRVAGLLFRVVGMRLGK